MDQNTIPHLYGFFISLDYSLYSILTDAESAVSEVKRCAIAILQVSSHAPEFRESTANLDHAPFIPPTPS